MKIFEEIGNAKTIAISGHLDPDGDAIGASVGLLLFLKKALHDVRIDVLSGNVKDSLKRYMPNVNDICFDGISDVEKYDVFIMLDTADDRLGNATEYYNNAVKKINIDHHESNSGCGDVSYIKPDVSSTSELIYDIIEDSVLPDGRKGSELIDEDIARALYIGIITDTGVFKYSNTSERTMQVGGRLMTYLKTIEPGTLIDNIFYAKSYIQNQILGRALLESMLFRDGTCIVSVLDEKTMDFYHVDGKDTDGIVSQLMLTDGVKIAIFLHEIKPMTYKVSLRSDGSVNVAAIASFYGGGGHDRAAGCTINAPYHDIINNISDSIDIQLAGKQENK